MDHDRRRRLLEHLAGEVSEEEREAMERLLESSAETRDELRRLLSLRRILRESAADGFGPGFTDRVMRALPEVESAEVGPAPDEGPAADWLARLFYRFAPVGLAVAGLVATLNVAGSDRAAAGSLLARALALPPVTVESSVSLAAAEALRADLGAWEVRP